MSVRRPDRAFGQHAKPAWVLREQSARQSSGRPRPSPHPIAHGEKGATQVVLFGDPPLNAVFDGKTFGFRTKLSTGTTIVITVIHRGRAPPASCYNDA